MRVFSTKQSEIVWDGEHNQALCSFSQGVFETDDMELVKKLVAFGYQCDCEVELEDDKTQDDEVIPEDEVIQENEVIPEDTTQKKSTTKKNAKKDTSNDEE